MSFGLDRYFKKKKSTPKKKKPLKKESTPKPKTRVSDIKMASKRDWPSILEETVKAMVLYPHHLNYTRSNIFSQNPSITPEELAVRLHIPLGVAIIILKKLREEEELTD